MVSVALAEESRFLVAMHIWGGAMISFLLSTSIYNFVLRQFLTMHALPTPILAHPLGTTLPPVKMCCQLLSDYFSGSLLPEKRFLAQEHAIHPRNTQLERPGQMNQQSPHVTPPAGTQGSTQE